MLRKTVSKVIGEKQYDVTQLGAIKGSQVFVRLVKLIGPVMANAQNASGLADALGALKEEDVEYLIKAFSPSTFVQGTGQLDQIFDIHFAGRYKDLFAWLLFCVEVNFGDFLGGSDLLGALAAKAGSVSPSPTAVTGPSGAS